MNSKRIFAGLVVCAVFALFQVVLAGDDASLKGKELSNSEKAKMLLEKARKTMKRMKGYSATMLTENLTGKSMTSKYYALNNPDGTVSMRMETAHIPPMVFITNSQGHWYIVGDVAIKLNYMTKMQANAMANIGQLPKVQDDVTYSVENGKINDVECFVVTTKMSDKRIKAAADFILKSLSEDMRKIVRKNKMDLTANIPVMTKLYIGKDDLFVYSVEQYSKAGTRISRTTYKDVKLNVAPDKHLFEIPADKKVKVAKTIMDLPKIMMGASKEKVNK